MILHLIPHAVLLGCCVVVSALIDDSTLAERPYEVLRKQNLGTAVSLQRLRPVGADCHNKAARALHCQSAVYYK